jgi:hypothetical protein
MERPEGADQDDAERALGVIEGEALGAVAAAGVPDEDGRVEPDGVHEGGHVGGVVLGAVAGLRVVGVAVPALGQRVHVQRSGQLRQQELPRAPGVAVAVQQDDRHSVRVALLDAGQREAGGEGDRGGRGWHRDVPLGLRERVSGLGWSPRRGRRGDPRSSVPPDSWLTSDADRAGVAFELAGAADVDGLDLDAQPPAGQRAVEPQA